MLKGIGGESTVVGELKIQLTFVKLSLDIDVDFSIIAGHAPSLLSNRDTVGNWLYFSLQSRYIHIGSLWQELELENFFFIYRWIVKSIPYDRYMEKDLHTIQRSFGYKAINATLKLAQKTRTVKYLDKTRYFITLENYYAVSE